MPHRTHSYIHIQTLEIKGEGMSKAYFIYILIKWLKLSQLIVLLFMSLLAHGNRVLNSAVTFQISRPYLHLILSKFAGCPPFVTVTDAPLPYVRAKYRMQLPFTL